MRSIRLLPIVVMAASALLALKTLGIATGTGYTLGGLSVATAQEAGGPGYSPEQVGAAEAAANALFESTPAPAAPFGDMTVFQQTNTGRPVPMPVMEEDTERAILERLAERRAELDALASELEMRLAVVEAAELRIEERLTELANIEGRINALVEAREAEEEGQFSGIVAMYESMRPADAAAIFNTLDTAVLTRVGAAMNPRKLGPILAKMAPARAQELTVLLANPEGNAATHAAPQDFAHLPQIIGQ